MTIHQILVKGLHSNKLTIKEYNDYNRYCLELDAFMNSKYHIVLTTNQYDDEF